MGAYRESKREAGEEEAVMLDVEFLFWGLCWC